MAPHECPALSLWCPQPAPARGANPAAKDPAAKDPDKSTLFGWLADDREPALVMGAFMHTPPFPLLLTAVPAGAAADLAAKTLNGRPLAAVNSYQETAAAFAAGRSRSAFRLKRAIGPTRYGRSGFNVDRRAFEYDA